MAAVFKLTRPPAAKKPNAGEDAFAFQCRALKLPPVTPQYKFAKEAKGRLWSLDFCFVEWKLAIEIEGVVFKRTAGGELVASGRHASPRGFEEDCVKYATAAELGFTVIRFTPQQVKSGYAIEMAQRVLHARGWRP